MCRWILNCFDNFFKWTIRIINYSFYRSLRIIHFTKHNFRYCIQNHKAQNFLHHSNPNSWHIQSRTCCTHILEMTYANTIFDTDETTNAPATFRWVSARTLRIPTSTQAWTSVSGYMYIYLSVPNRRRTFYSCYSTVQHRHITSSHTETVQRHRRQAALYTAGITSYNTYWTHEKRVSNLYPTWAHGIGMQNLTR